MTAPDDGRPDARLVAALAACDGSAPTYAEVLAALSGARVFLAIAARSLDPAHRSHADMSLVSLVAASGERALPAFADGQQVQRWRGEARPAPVQGPDACRAALDDGASVLLLDPLGAAVAVPTAALSELAAGRVPVPGASLSSRSVSAELSGAVAADPALLLALSRALSGEDVVAARLLDGPDGPVLGLAGPEGPAALADLAGRLRARLGADLPDAGLDVALVPASGPGVPVPLPGRRRWWRRG